MELKNSQQLNSQKTAEGNTTSQGKENLETVVKLYDQLKDLGFSHEQILSMATGGKASSFDTICAHSI